MRSVGLAIITAAVSLAGFARAEDVNVTVGPKSMNPPPIKCGYFTAMTVGCEGAMAQALKKRGELQQETGQLIADGRCDEAMKAALREGDFGMAQKVKDMCAALYPPSPKPAQ